MPFWSWSYERAGKTVKKSTEGPDYLNLLDCCTCSIKMVDGVTVAYADYLFAPKECGNCKSLLLLTDAPKEITFLDAPNFGHSLLVQLTISILRV